MRNIWMLGVIFVALLGFSQVVWALEPWEMKKEHIGVIIDSGHALYGTNDPDSANANSQNFLRYDTKNAKGKTRGRSCIDPSLIPSNDIDDTCGKYLRFNNLNRVVTRIQNDYVEPEGMVFFSRGLQDILKTNNIASENTRDLSTPLDVMLGNPFRIDAVTFKFTTNEDDETIVPLFIYNPNTVLSIPQINLQVTVTITPSRDAMSITVSQQNSGVIYQQNINQNTPQNEFNRVLAISVPNLPFLNIQSPPGVEIDRLESIVEPINNIHINYEIETDDYWLGVRRSNIENDWRHGAVTYLCEMRDPSFCPLSSSNPTDPSDENLIRELFGEEVQDNDREKDWILISYHSNSGGNSDTRGLFSSRPNFKRDVQIGSSDQVISCHNFLEPQNNINGDPSRKNDLLTLSKARFTQFLADAIVSEIQRNNINWPQRGRIIDEAVCDKEGAVILSGSIPSSIIELTFHDNINSLNTLLAYNKINEKNIVAQGTFEGIKKFFNANVESTDDQGQNWDVFNMISDYPNIDDVWAKGTGFPKNHNIRLNVVRHKNYNTDYTRGEDIKKIAVNSQENAAKIGIITDNFGNFGPVKVWTPTMEGEFDIVAKIYDYEKFQWVDAVDSMELGSDGKSKPGFEVMKCGSICSYIYSSDESSALKTNFFTNEKVYAAFALENDGNEEVQAKIFVIKNEVAEAGPSWQNLADQSSDGPEEITIPAGVGQVESGKQVVWLPPLTEGVYRLVVDLNNNGLFDSADRMAADPFTVRNIITQLDADVDPEGNVHVIGIAENTNSNPPPIIATRLMYARIPHDSNYKIDLEHPELFDWSVAKEVKFTEIPRTPARISNPKIAVDMNGEPYIIWERQTADNKWLQWTKLTKDGLIDTQFFFVIKKQQSEGTLGEPHQLFENVFLAEGGLLNISSFRSSINVSESVAVAPIIFYRSQPFVEYDLREPDIAIDPQDNRPIITAIINAKAPSTLFMQKILPILSLGINPNFFIYPSGTFSQGFNLINEAIIPPLYFAESVQVAKLIGTELGVFSFGWPSDYTPGGVRYGQDVAVFTDTMNDIADLVNDMAIPSERSDHWKWRHLDSASLRTNFDMFSNPQIEVDTLSNLHVIYHKGSSIFVGATGDVWDPDNPNHLNFAPILREMDVFVNNSFSVVMYKKVPITSQDLPSNFNMIKIPQAGSDPIQVSLEASQVKPNSIDLAIDSDGESHIVWQSNNKLKYTKSPDFEDNNVSQILSAELGISKIIIDTKNNPIVLWNDKLGLEEKLLLKKVLTINRTASFSHTEEIASSTNIRNPLLAINSISNNNTGANRIYSLWINSNDVGSRVLLKRTMPHTTILLILDGFNSSVFYDNLNSMDILKDLIENNPTVNGSAVIPSPFQTFSSQASLITALQPENHGILGDNFTRGDGQNISYIPDNSHDVNQDLNVSTIYDFLSTHNRSKAVIASIITKGVGGQLNDKIIPPTTIDWNSGSNNAEDSINSYFNILNTNDQNTSNDPAELITVYVLKNTHNQISDYASYAANVDDTIGLLIDKLQNMKMFNDTVLIITSDHGESGNINDTLVPIIITGPGLNYFSAQGQSFEIEENIDITDIGTTTTFFVAGKSLVDSMVGVDGQNLFDPQLSFTAESPVRLHLYDEEGNHVGPKANNIETEIPLSYYTEDPETDAKEIILLQAPEKYRFELESYAEGPVHLSLRHSKLGQKILIEYPEFIIVNHSRGKIDAINDDFILVLDKDNNGIFEETIEPSTSLQINQRNNSATIDILNLELREPIEVDVVDNTNAKIILEAYEEISNENIQIEKLNFIESNGLITDNVFGVDFAINISMSSNILANTSSELAIVIPEDIIKNKGIAKYSLSIFELVSNESINLNFSEESEAIIIVDGNDVYVDTFAFFDDKTNILTTGISGPGTFVILATDKIPSITDIIINPAKTSISTSNISVTSSVIDNQAVSNVSIMFNGNTIEMQHLGGSQYTATLIGPTQSGKYPILISAVDNNGNLAEKTIFYELDDVAPNITIKYPGDNSFLIRNTFDFTYFVDELSNQTFILDGLETNTNITSPYRTTKIRLNNLSAGPHELSIRAIDDVANEALKTININVDSHNTLVSNLQLPLASKPGLVIPISFKVENTLSFDESEVLAELVVDNTVVSTQNLSLGGNEIKQLSFEYISIAGRHNITIRTVPIVGERFLDDNRLSAELLVTNKIPLLLVEDDGIQETNAFINAIATANVGGMPGFDYVLWDIEEKGIPSTNILQQLRGVIWYTGTSEETLSAQERKNIEEYVESGGNLFISGSKIGSDIGSTDIYNNVFKSKFVSQSTQNIVEGKLFTIGQGFLFELNQAGEVITPSSGTKTAFVYTGDGAAGLTYNDEIKHITYLSFAFESMPTFDEQRNLMSKVLDFFEIDVAAPIISDIKPLSGTKYPINTSNISVSIKTDEIANCRQSITPVLFESMNPFDVTNSKTHSTSVQDIQNGVNTTIRIACKDSDGNIGIAESQIFIWNRTFNAPVIQPIDDLTILENGTLQLQVQVSDPENDDFQVILEDFERLGITRIANHFTFDNTSTFNLESNFEDAGQYFLRIKVIDLYNISSEEFKLTIENVDRPPIIEQINPQFLMEGNYYNLTVIASDPDNDQITFFDSTELFNINQYLGKIAFTPKQSQIGIYTVNITARSLLYEIVQEVQFIVVDNENRSALPVIEFIPPKTAFVDHPFELQVIANDSDSSQLIYFDNSDFFDITPTGFINFTPTESQLGSHVFTIQVTDGTSLVHRQINILITRPPFVRLLPIGNITAIAGELITIRPNITFVNGT